MADAPRLLLGEIDTVSVETAIREECCAARKVIADPIYSRLLPDEADKFISFPHEAYSGRHYRKDIPCFIGSFVEEWATMHLDKRRD